jgi:hypothetical protein
VRQVVEAPESINHGDNIPGRGGGLEPEALATDPYAEEEEVSQTTKLCNNFLVNGGGLIRARLRRATRTLLASLLPVCLIPFLLLADLRSMFWAVKVATVDTRRSTNCHRNERDQQQGRIRDSSS